MAKERDAGRCCCGRMGNVYTGRRKATGALLSQGEQEHKRVSESALGTAATPDVEHSKAACSKQVNIA